MGIKVLAVTDHDIRPPDYIDGEEICEYAKSKGVTILKGIEISCETEIDDVHIVCFGCDWKDRYFDDLEKSVVQSKVEGYRALVEKLSENGVEISWEEILDNNGNPILEEQIQKKMIFEALARKDFAKDWSAAKLAVKNSPDYQIKRRKPNPRDAIREAKRTGGVSILAHPFLINDPRINREEYIESLIEAGLNGIEASYTYDKTSYGGSETKEQIEKYIRQKYSGRLEIISGGSDYHADYKKGVINPREIGECGVSEEYFNSNPVLQSLI
jgi:fructose-bisphosphate aldolase class II